MRPYNENYKPHQCVEVNGREYEAVDVGLLVEDLARLRGLIKRVEWRDLQDHNGDGFCPWCGNGNDEPHFVSCPAFTPDGQVK